MNPLTQNLGSVTGIVALTIMAVGLLKRLLGNVKGANAVPTWIYAVAVAALLTVIAVNVLHTMPGPLLNVIVQAVMAAAAASGFYEWYSNAGKPLAASAQSAGVKVAAANKPAAMKR